MDTSETPALIWPRWSAYRRRRGGWIYADGDPRAPYELDGDDDLVSHLAAAAGRQGERFADSLPRLWTFYDTYGLLGGTLLFRRRRVVIAGRVSVRAGDNAAWALRHARNVALIQSLEYSRGPELDRIVAALAVPIGERQPGALGSESNRVVVYREASRQVPTCSGRGWTRIRFDLTEAYRQASASGPAMLQLARRIIGELLTPNLASVNRVFDPETGVARFQFTALIQAVYWQLADRLGYSKLGRCNCGALFFQLDPRQRHCPPHPGRKESACAQRFRRRRLRRDP